jgi:membrane associated rhomboid family serine protease
VLGAYFILYPRSTVFGLLGIFPVRISAYFFLGFWFLYQLVWGNFGLFDASAHGGGTAFFAHIGGFLFGVIVARVLLAGGRIESGAGDPEALRVPA